MKKHLFWLLALWPIQSFAGGGAAEAVLEEQRVGGYHSASVAVDQLLAAGGANSESVDPDAWCWYQGELARLAVDAMRPDVAERARSALAASGGTRDEGAAGQCRFQLLLGQAREALRSRQPEQAAAFIEEARLLVPRADDQARLKLEMTQAALLDAQEDLSAAISTAMAALALAERLGNSTDAIRLKLLLMGAGADLGHIGSAEAMAREVIAAAGAAGYVEAVALAQLNRGYWLAGSDRRDRQLEALQAALAISEGDPRLAEVEAISRANLADYFLHQGDFQQTLVHSGRAEALARRIGDRLSEAVALANSGIAMAGLGELSAGTTKVDEAMQLAEQQGYKVLTVDIGNELVLMLERAGRYREALQVLQRARVLDEEITRQEREKAVMELQEKYATERRDREIERLTAMNRLNQAEVEARSWRQRLWAALAVAMALATIVLVQWLKKARRQNRRLNDANADLAKQSVHDPLTGAFNRRRFEWLMEQHAQRVEAGELNCVGLMLLDVDLFKEINDHHGHDAGDAVLVELTRRLRGLLRDQDAVVRWGGEEFVLLLPGTPPGGLEVLAQRVLRAVGGEPVRAGNTAIPVTVSAGCISHPLHVGQGWQDALRLADAAMYLAKQQGRNRAACVVAAAHALLNDAVVGDLLAAREAGQLEVRMLAGPQRPEPGHLRLAAI